MGRDFYEGKKVLVTGARGYLGSVLVRKLTKLGASVTSLTSSQETDICEAVTWEKALASQEIVFHLAAQTDHKRANQDPSGNFRANAGSVLLLLETCRKFSKSPRIVFASTATVVGLTDEKPTNEQFLPRPRSLYDIHKLTAEHYLGFYADEYGADTAVARVANLYGPSEGSSHESRGILNVMAERAIKGEELTVYGKGEWKRDYLYIEDAIDGFLALGSAPTSNVKGRTFNLSTGRAISFVDAVKTLVKVVARYTGKDTKISYVPVPESLPGIETRNYSGDFRALFQATEWKPSVSLETGIDRLVVALTGGNNL
jgi:UDP-glucose 4-epimerase